MGRYVGACCGLQTASMNSKRERWLFQAQGIQAFNRKVREELICAICLDFLTEPKLLLCAHSFCQECLEGIVTMQTNYAMQASLVLNEGDLICPSCRHVTTLPDGRVDGLKTNYNLKRLVDIVSEEEKTDVPGSDQTKMFSSAVPS